MTTKTIVSSRRQVLRGAGGFTLALPFLSSLATPARSFAQVVPFKRKRFFSFLKDHGGINVADMFPLASANQKMDMFPGHTINYGKFTRTVNGTTASISPVLSGPASLLTDAVASKINAIRGLDYPFYLGHNGGGQLGNIAGNDGVAGGDQLVAQKLPNVTIDQQMAWSPSFYADSVPRQRYIWRYGYTNASKSYTWTSPTTRSGNIVMTKAQPDLGAIFDSLFMGGVTQPPPVVTRPLIVDRVLASYKGLRDGNARLSVFDKQRLTDHMDRLSELQRKLTANQMQQMRPPLAACKAPSRPANGRANVAYFKLLNDLIAAAFICDTTRVAVSGFEEETEVFIPYTGVWHEGVAHQYSSAAGRALLAQQGQAIFEAIFLDLASKLQVDEGDGSTVLDNSLLLWSQESGNETHVPLSVPIITIGSAGGYFNTGNYVDYRSQVPATSFRLNVDTHNGGITYNRMMANVLHGMGVAPSEWQVAGKPGFGQTYLWSGARTKYSATVLATANDPLPIITNG